MKWKPSLSSPFLKLPGFLLVCTFFLKPIAHGIIFYDYDSVGGTNDDQHQSIPDPERAHIFNAVARVCDENGENTSGSATYLRGKYLLTADHVSNRSHVTFDGSTFYERDIEFVPKQIVVAGANVDLKLIKLVEVPEFSGSKIEINLNADASSELVSAADVLEVTLVGWGVGRDPNVEDLGEGLTNIWTWGDQSTTAKRWGSNNIKASKTPLTYSSDNKDYSYEALETDLSLMFFLSEAGIFFSSEACIARFDSGSGIFANINDEWRLVGIATSIIQKSVDPNPVDLNSGANISTFSLDSDNPNDGGSVVPPADLNYFVRISSYASEIEAAIPDTSTYSGWKIDHSLYDTDALDTADTDGDGINQLLEFALGGDPNQSDVNILPTSQLVKDGNETYLEVTLTRPKGLQNITYIPQITTDFSKWTNPNEPDVAIEFTISDPIDNGEGTESLNYRFKVTALEKLFVRFLIFESF